jgi:predicted nucleotide-binding protein
VVLLSPDDTGYSNADGPAAAKLRARQNVILELGYFAGKLGRENVVALHRGSIELPSDYDGVLYTPYDGDSGTWRSELVAELRDSGYSVSADNL